MNAERTGALTHEVHSTICYVSTLPVVFGAVFTGRICGAKGPAAGRRVEEFPLCAVGAGTRAAHRGRALQPRPIAAQEEPLGLCRCRLLWPSAHAVLAGGFGLDYQAGAPTHFAAAG